MSKEELLNNPLVKEIAQEFTKHWDVVTNQRATNNAWDDFVKSKTKKDWTILAFIATEKHGCKGYILPISDITSPIEKYLENADGFWNIYSVRRESDGEVFTVGDSVECRGEKDMPIKYIQIVSDKLTIGGGYCIVCGLDELKHPKKPLFSTEDGVDIYEGGEAWHITTKYGNLNDLAKIIFNNFRQQEALHNIGLFFSTKEKAEEYIIMNKPCLSLQEIVYDTKPAWVTQNIYDNLKELVKNKLKLNE